MQVRHIIGLTLLLMAAVPLQIYCIKYNQDLLQLVTEYVCAAKNYLQNTFDYLSLSKPFEDDSPEDQEVPENLIRNFRPPHLEFRIGNVVLTNNIKLGVIVGWDIDMTDLTKEPEYLILLEHHEELIKLDQDKILDLLENIEVNNKRIDQYFESFDGLEYIPNKPLRKMYPKG